MKIKSHSRTLKFFKVKKPSCVCFCTTNSTQEKTNNPKIYKEIIAELESSKKPLKVYESLYDFRYEKIFVNASYLFGLVSGSVIFSQSSILFKVFNLVLFVPSVIAIVDRIIGHSFFVSQVNLISPTEIEVINCYKRKLILKIEDLIPIEANTQVKNKDRFNHELYRIVTIKKKLNFLYFPRHNSVLCTFLIEDIFNGNKLI